MKRRAFVKTAGAVAAVSGLKSSSFGAKPKKPPKPNIIVILSDDMGYSDIGCFGRDSIVRLLT